MLLSQLYANEGGAGEFVPMTAGTQRDIDITTTLVPNIRNITGGVYTPLEVIYGITFDNQCGELTTYNLLVVLQDS